MSQKKLSRHNSRQSSIGCETASVASIKSFRSDHSQVSSSSLMTKSSIALHSSNYGHLGRQGSQESSGSGSGSGSVNGTNGKNSNTNSSKKSIQTSNSQIYGGANGISKTGANSKLQTTTNILNVAEMILHGVSDNEILDIWLHSIHCNEFVVKFIDAGYDMPTLSRITPQDLTAIGVTDPTKRSKILTEIKKLNLQDGIPTFKPASLSEWLSLIRLDKFYYQLLCDQDINTIDKLCQLTWEDFEDLGITRLGHQKRIQLAIERIKELDSSDNSSKTLSEPIYDTNPSQILLVASTENHSMNGPIINKQSSTSELSSTGSGSMHSVYSAASTQYQQHGGSSSNENNLNSNSQTPPDSLPNNHLTHSHHYQSQNQQQIPPPPIFMQTQSHQQRPQQQTIYSQPVPQMIYQSPQTTIYGTLLPPAQTQSQPQTQTQPQHPTQVYQMTHYQTPIDCHMLNSRISQNNIHIGFQTNNEEVNGFGSTLIHPQTIQNRQSMSQLPALSRLANLPKHQQHLLQQSSIYATLTRQPTMKRTPPPVPVRINSLKTNSLTDDISNIPQSQSNFQVSLPNRIQQIQQNANVFPNQSQPAINDHANNLNEKSEIETRMDNPTISQQKGVTNNNASFNATTGKDEDFPPPPSPLPCIIESFGITT